MSQYLAEYFSGEKLYGDDFSPADIEAWYRDEEDAYVKLLSNTEVDHNRTYHYEYHQLNRVHGFAHLGQRNIGRALGLGSAAGEEFLPIIGRISSLTILEPGREFGGIRRIGATPCEYVRPAANGDMPFSDSQFDLITCFGVLHHIANVSHVLSECYRCLATSGVMLVREPIVSMGDWTKPRAGLTKRERGIPLKVFQEIIRRAGFVISNEALFDFPPVVKGAKLVGIDPFNSRIITRLDALVAAMFAWNARYHATRFAQKLRPCSVYLVLSKA